jgi:hypothetical protein
VSQATSPDESKQARRGPAGLATVAAYSMLGAILLATRTAGLNHSFWTDEITDVESFIRAGPRNILAGPDLSHELFGLLAWTTSTLTGESEIAFRLWSVVPFILGVVLVTTWLHVRKGSLAGVLFLFFATVSPLLLDITRQARGYGLGFFAMSALIVAALEAERSGRTWWLVAFCAAGIVGTWTLPQLGIAFLATGSVLLTSRDLRRRAALAMSVSLVAIGAWYAPHLGQIHMAAQIEDGVQIDTVWLLTAPIDQVLIPALVWIDGTALVAGLVWLPLVLLALLIIGSSALMREKRTALLMTSGVVATIVVLWFAQAYVIPRYLSFLLVPLFVLLATGMAEIFARLRQRPAVIRTVASLVVIGVLAIHFATIAPDVMRLPREANADAAAVILSGSPKIPVLAYMRNPRNLEYYLGRPVRSLDPSEVAGRVCRSRTTVFYVMQPFGIKAVNVPCLTRNGVQHHRFEQYARGDEMNVWLVPPST